MEDQSIELVPGVETYGIGYDITSGQIPDGDYFSHHPHQVVEISSKTSEQTIQNHLFLVPDSLQVYDEDPTYHLVQHQGDTVGSVSEQYAASLGIGASYLGFSASLGFKFSENTKTFASSYYMIGSEKSSLWSVRGNENVPQVLSSDTQKALEQLPSPYGPEDAKAYFEFFQKFGTHYVSYVEMGGSLNFYNTINKKENTNTGSYGAEAKASYAGVMDAEGEASKEWENVSKNFVSNMTLVANGGDTSQLFLGPVSYRENKSAAISAWKKTILDAPAELTYSIILKQISDLAGNRKNDLEAAYQDYIKTRLVMLTPAVTVDPKAFLVSPTLKYTLLNAGNTNLVKNMYYDESSSTPPYDSPDNSTLTVAIIDRSNMSIAYQKSWNWSKAGGFNYEAVSAAVKPYQTAGKYSCIVSYYGWLDTIPTGGFATFIKTFSSGAGLADWTKAIYHGSPTSFQYSLGLYLAVGDIGDAASGSEHFTYAQAYNFSGAPEGVHRPKPGMLTANFVPGVGGKYSFDKSTVRFIPQPVV